jgi:hypothetical protein
MLAIDFLSFATQGNGSFDRSQWLDVACKQKRSNFVNGESFDGDVALENWKFHSRDPDSLTCSAEVGSRGAVQDDYE